MSRIFDLSLLNEFTIQEDSLKTTIDDKSDWKLFGNSFFLFKGKNDQEYFRRKSLIISKLKELSNDQVILPIELRELLT